MAKLRDTLALAKAIISNPRIIRVKPSISWFLYKYLRKFRVRNVGGLLIIHSHLPPVNSKAYSRFLEEHVLAKSRRPT